ncbi:MAG: hypothetical protein DRJ69_03745 [Thermoprotei archaeon]|nr:MAG: hypothetical protein DRJ69_03745 [Thermoprotei archaeon]
MSEILAEGRADRVFIKQLLNYINKSTEITVEGGKGNVCNKLRRKHSLVAFIDEDPGSTQPSYLKQVKQSGHNITPSQAQGFEAWRNEIETC